MNMSYVYGFDQSPNPEDGAPRSLLGGKGANLAEMTRLGLPVPPGFTVSTPTCLAYLAEESSWPQGAKEQVLEALDTLSKKLGKSLGDGETPLLVSVRSGAAVSMPGMMDTVLNLGLNDQTVEVMAKATGTRRFAYDSYRRLLQMYSDVVLDLDRDRLEDLLEQAKEREGVFLDSELSVEALEGLVATYKLFIQDATGAPFPSDPLEQLWAAIEAVFSSWHNRRAIDYRNAHDIPHDLGTAVNIQAMVFGNMGEDSATGVAFTRDPSTGDKRFFGEWLRNAQGEDVVAGIRTPQPINHDCAVLEGDETLQDGMPGPYADLVKVYENLELHYLDMQDIEFTIEAGVLWMLQTRTGKRTPRAEVKIAVDMVHEGLIDKREAVRRVSTVSVEKLLHPQLDPNAPRNVVVRGLGASPGAATGTLSFHADDAVERAGRGEAVILVRRETSPEDIHGMLKAQGILTARGGMTSHAAVVARGLSKPCIVGAGELRIDSEAGTLTLGGLTLTQRDTITLDGGDGTVMLGHIPTIQPETRPEVEELMGWVDTIRRLGVWTNADTARDCQVARDFGAEGIGLCRTEHMFFDEERILAVRQMILAEDEDGRRLALDKLLPMQKDDFKAIFEVMETLPVTIRLLDPPLHEFLPQTDEEVRTLARDLGVDYEELATRNHNLEEVNPMLGHRGCRLGLTYPEIYEMQVRAIVEAAAEVKRDTGLSVQPKIMIPLVSHERELSLLRQIVETTIERVLKGYEGTELDVAIGTMIELPRACITADAIAVHADFFSFGTNDLTQTTFGISRDDGAKFLPLYADLGVLGVDPFIAMDPAVATLVEMAVERGRAVRPGLNIGLCGEHGGEPSSVARCHVMGLDYVSCSPFRIPVARLAAAHAVLNEEGS
jgi:pyruvate,orthophosphate dikinase